MLHNSPSSHPPKKSALRRRLAWHAPGLPTRPNPRPRDPRRGGRAPPASWAETPSRSFPGAQGSRALTPARSLRTSVQRDERVPRSGGERGAKRGFEVKKGAVRHRHASLRGRCAFRPSKVESNAAGVAPPMHRADAPRMLCDGARGFFFVRRFQASPKVG